MPEKQYMLRAIELAMLGVGKVNPNPLVGAVIVKDGRIIGEGYHRQYGGLHAEREALADCMNCGENPAGAEMYVTLEPCCHRGKQPPCTEAVVDAKISRVYVGSSDPNPLVAGKGIEYLAAHGIDVQTDYLKTECDSINSIFFHFITKGVPYVAIKYAMTADGKIATVTGASKWITGEIARNHVHGLRNRYAAIMVGIGTVLKDNPMLNCRIEGGINPIRIVADSHLRIPLDSNIVKSAAEIPTIVACATCNSEKRAALKKYGVEVLEVPDSDKKVNMNALVKILGARKVDSLLIEGGGCLNYSAFKAGVVNHVYSYVAPKIFGGEVAKSPVSGSGICDVADAFKLKMCTTALLGDDILIEYEVL